MAYTLDLTQMRIDLGTEELNQLEDGRTEIETGLTGIADIVVKNIDPRIKSNYMSIGENYPILEKGDIKTRLDEIDGKIENIPVIEDEIGDYPSDKGTIAERLDALESSDSGQDSRLDDIESEIGGLNDVSIVMNHMEFHDQSWYKSNGVFSGSDTNLQWSLIQLVKNDSGTVFKFFGHVDLGNSCGATRTAIKGKIKGSTWYGVNSGLNIFPSPDKKPSGFKAFELSPLGISWRRNTSTGTVIDVQYCLGAVDDDGYVIFDCSPNSGNISVGSNEKLIISFFPCLYLNEDFNGLGA